VFSSVVYYSEPLSGPTSTFCSYKALLSLRFNCSTSTKSSYLCILICKHGAVRVLIDDTKDFSGFSDAIH